MIDVKYFREYRELLGFTSQSGIKDFFAAKDITPEVDYIYIELLNERLIEITKKINELVAAEIKIENLMDFCNKNIKSVFEKLKNNKY